MAHHRRHRHRYHSAAAGYAALQERGSGGAGSANEGVFMIIFGCVFLAVGCFVAWLMNSNVEGVVKENAGIGTAAGILFAIIGAAIIFSGVKAIVKRRKIIAEGKRIRGKIWQYEPDPSFFVNGQPGISLVVHYFGDGGMPKEITVKTGSINEKKFPLGATVEVSIAEDGAVLIPKSVSHDPVPGEEELLKPLAGAALGAPQGYGETAAGMMPMAVACPGCGATVMVVPGNTVICPSCGRQFTLTADRMIV